MDKDELTPPAPAPEMDEEEVIVEPDIEFEEPPEEEIPGVEPEPEPEPEPKPVPTEPVVEEPPPRTGDAPAAMPTHPGMIDLHKDSRGGLADRITVCRVGQPDEDGRYPRYDIAAYAGSDVQPCSQVTLEFEDRSDLDADAEIGCVTNEVLCAILIDRLEPVRHSDDEIFQCHNLIERALLNMKEYSLRTARERAARQSQAG